MKEGDRSLAVFIDFENLALGFQGRRERFQIGRVLERLVEKGKIVVKKAYADWNRFSSFTQALHEAAIELIEIPRRAVTGKNSADIRLVVDAMDLAYSKDHINTFVIVSGDSDFSPLVSKLKELGKHVIGLGMQESTSDLLRDNCDEFIYYEDLGREPVLEAEIDLDVPETKRKAFAMLMDALQALRRENKDVLWSSMIKDTIKRKKPSFNESYHGYRTFSELLEDAAHQGLLTLETDKRSRTYVVTRFGAEMHDANPPAAAAATNTASEVPSATSPVVVVPSPLGVQVAPQLFSATPPPAPTPTNAASTGLATGEGATLLPRKKSRRRRRRGGGGGANGQHAAAAMPGSEVPADVSNLPAAAVMQAGGDFSDADSGDEPEDENAPPVDLQPPASSSLPGLPASLPAAPRHANEAEQSFTQGVFDEESPTAAPAPATAEPAPAAQPADQPASKSRRSASTRKKTSTSKTKSPTTKTKRASGTRKKSTEAQQASESSE